MEHKQFDKFIGVYKLLERRWCLLNVYGAGNNGKVAGKVGVHGIFCACFWIGNDFTIVIGVLGIGGAWFVTPILIQILQVPVEILCSINKCGNVTSLSNNAWVSSTFILETIFYTCSKQIVKIERKCCTVIRGSARLCKRVSNELAAIVVAIVQLHMGGIIPVGWIICNGAIRISNVFVFLKLQHTCMVLQH